MNYFRVYFGGGPCDGGREPSMTGERYPQFAMVGSDIQRMGIYEYAETRVQGSEAERHYRFIKHVGLDEGREFLDSNPTWL